VAALAALDAAAAKEQEAEAAAVAAAAAEHPGEDTLAVEDGTLPMTGLNQQQQQQQPMDETACAGAVQGSNVAEAAACEAHPEDQGTAADNDDAAAAAEGGLPLLPVAELNNLVTDGSSLGVKMERLAEAMRLQVRLLWW
jgi:hypothetical protein